MNTLDELWKNIEKWKKEVEEEEHELRSRNPKLKNASSKSTTDSYSNGKEQHTHCW